MWIFMFIILYFNLANIAHYIEIVRLILIRVHVSSLSLHAAIDYASHMQNGQVDRNPDSNTGRGYIYR